MTDTPATPSGRRVYTRVRSLARGGMGEVEVVVRSEGSFQRVYARKRLHSIFAAEPAVRAMFVDEARIAGLVRHVNVVSVLDVGEDADGPFLVMDLVEGPPVSRLLELAGGSGEELPIPVALDIARQAALGLHAAHELRNADGVPLDVVHRDVSPQNILVGFDGTVRVTDFGVARALDRMTETADGALKGKSGYMSPEQLRYRPLDRRTDIFSLGVVLWEMLAGERLYAGERPTAFRRILEEPAPRIRSRRAEVPPPVDALVASMLEKDPAARPATARDVAARLDEVLRAAPADLAGHMEARYGEERARMAAMVAEALRSSPGEQASHRRASGPRQVRRARLALVLGSLLLVAGALAFAHALRVSRDDAAEPEPITIGSHAQPPAPAGRASAGARSDHAAARPAITETPARADDVAEPEASERAASEMEDGTEGADRALDREPRRAPRGPRTGAHRGAMSRKSPTPGLWWELPAEGERRSPR